jgi:serine/threonine-protein kinase
MRVCPRCRLKYPDIEERCFVDGVHLVEAPDPFIGTTIHGRYTIEEKLGEGGMATVYRGRLSWVDRPIAVKVINPNLARDPKLRERFKREADNAKKVAHPNIVEIYQCAETDDGTPFMVMELLDGCTLSQVISRGPIDPQTTIAIGLQIAQGLARAHDFAVIHRDLKPDNVFLCNAPGGLAPHVKLLDFGVARSMHDERLTNAGEIFGTPQYMAPERVTSIDAGAPADLYALGCILYEMAVGQPPFVADDITGYFLKHMSEVPARPSARMRGIPRRLEDLVLALLMKKPEERPVDAHQVIKELASLLADFSKTAVMPAAPVATPARPMVAPTLPPTTLERWARRTALFDQMLGRAFPGGGAPRPLLALLAEIRGDLARIHELRQQGLGEQRKLEALEGEARDGRARLGHAVHTLAQDLSRSRAEVRQAGAGVAPYFEADRQAEGAYRAAYQKLAARGGFREQDAPSAEMVALLRDGADALDRWLLSRGAADKARRWVEAKEREVSDLEYQVRILRGQLENMESEYDVSRQASELTLARAGREAQALEQSLIAKATRFCEDLRGRHELGDLFRLLEQEAG